MSVNGTTDFALLWKRLFPNPEDYGRRIIHRAMTRARLLADSLRNGRPPAHLPLPEDRAGPYGTGR
jgi:hypothetical protein